MTHILIADDHALVRKGLEMIIKSAFMPCSLSYAVDGDEVIKQIRATNFDLLILDLNMPGKHGLDCLNEIRATPAMRDITVAIYSTSSSPEDIEDTFVAGANIYIKKPHDFTAFKKIIEEVLSLSWLYVTDGFNRDNFILSY